MSASGRSKPACLGKRGNACVCVRVRVRACRRLLRVLYMDGTSKAVPRAWVHARCPPGHEDKQKASSADASTRVVVCCGASVEGALPPPPQTPIGRANLRPASTSTVLNLRLSTGTIQADTGSRALLRTVAASKTPARGKARRSALYLALAMEPLGS